MSSSQLSPWEQLKQDPRFVLRRQQQIDNAFAESVARIATVKVRNPADLISYRRDELIKQLETNCNNLYDIAKEVWQRDRTVTREFCRSLLEEGILPQLTKGFLYFAIKTDIDGSQAFDALDAKTFNEIDEQTGWRLYELEHRLKLTIAIGAADCDDGQNAPVVKTVLELVDDDYTAVSFKGRIYSLTGTQGQVLKRMWDRKPHTTTEILNSINTAYDTVKKIFVAGGADGKDFWDQFISVEGKTIRLLN